MLFRGVYPGSPPDLASLTGSRQRGVSGVQTHPCNVLSVSLCSCVCPTCVDFFFCPTCRASEALSKQINKLINQSDLGILRVSFFQLIASTEPMHTQINSSSFSSLHHASPPAREQIPSYSTSMHGSCCDFIVSGVGGTAPLHDSVVGRCGQVPVYSTTDGDFHP